MLGCAKKMQKKIKKKRLPVKIFAVKGSTLEACRRTVGPGIQPIFTRRTVQNMKVFILYKLKQHCVCKVSFVSEVTETIVKNLGLAGSSEWVGRFVLPLGC